jgi:hypothetical protein
MAPLTQRLVLTTRAVRYIIRKRVGEIHPGLPFKQVTLHFQSKQSIQYNLHFVRYTFRLNSLRLASKLFKSHLEEAYLINAWSIIHSIIKAFTHLGIHSFPYIHIAHQKHTLTLHSFRPSVPLLSLQLYSIQPDLNSNIKYQV